MRIGEEEVGVMMEGICQSSVLLHEYGISSVITCQKEILVSRAKKPVGGGKIRAVKAHFIWNG